MVACAAGVDGKIDGDGGAADRDGAGGGEGGGEGTAGPLASVRRGSCFRDGLHAAVGVAPVS